jgi:hypothetical protein
MRVHGVQECTELKLECTHHDMNRHESYNERNDKLDSYINCLKISFDQRNYIYSMVRKKATTGGFVKGSSVPAKSSQALK